MLRRYPGFDAGQTLIDIVVQHLANVVEHAHGHFDFEGRIAAGKMSPESGNCVTGQRTQSADRVLHDLATGGAEALLKITFFIQR